MFLKVIRDAGFPRVTIVFLDPYAADSAPARTITFDENTLATVRAIPERSLEASLPALVNLPIGSASVTMYPNWSAQAPQSGPGGKAAAAAKTVDPRDSEFYRQYLDARKKVAARIVNIQSMGGSIQQFQAGLAKADALYKQEDLKGALAGLVTLQDTVSEQEKRLSAAHASATASTTGEGPGAISSEPLPGKNMSKDDYYNRMVQNMLFKELGTDAPADGPFQLERFRTAKYIHELESQGKDVQGARYLYKQIDDLVASHDNRKVSEIVDKLNYLQKQLGLPPLKASPEAAPPGASK